MRIFVISAIVLIFQLSYGQDPAPTAAQAKTPPAAEGDNQMTMESFEETDRNLKQLLQPFVYERTETSRDPFALPEASYEPLAQGPVFGPFVEMNNITLDQITVKGIILDEESAKAIISYKLPGSDKTKTVKVKVGDPLGENFGRVQKIRDGKVVILQTLDENGSIRTTTHVLSLRKYESKPLN